MSNGRIITQQSSFVESSTNFLFREISIFNKKIPVVVILWFGLALSAAVAQLLRHSYNDYLIFNGVFWHTFHQTNLYLEYPQEYGDVNHYGPAFSFIIAPFALMPIGAGVLVWAMANAAAMLYAIQKLPITYKQKRIIIAVAAIDMMTATHYLQFNPMLTACIVLAFVFVEKEKDFWATLFMAIGFFVKLYGIGALLFFIFSKHKFKFVVSFLFWCAVLFCLPMLWSSPKFIVQSYYDWYYCLMIKDAQNANLAVSGGWQDISVMGMIRRFFNYPQLKDVFVLVPAGIVILLPVLRFKQYVSETFRLSYLAIVLISIVIFSTSAEAPTYVIAMTGVGIWFIIQNKSGKGTIFVLILALLLTSFSSSDLFPEWVKVHIIRPYALKALPCFIVWCWLIANLSFKNFIITKKTEPA